MTPQENRRRLNQLRAEENADGRKSARGEKRRRRQERQNERVLKDRRKGGSR